ncbi:hypothetical protein AB4305_33000 [Nocardia sp. 2YAB30]
MSSEVAAAVVAASGAGGSVPGPDPGGGDFDLGLDAERVLWTMLYEPPPAHR